MTRIAFASISLLITLSLTGCAFGPTAAPTPETGQTIHGIAHGGQQPVGGQKVYVLAANTTGYPTASTNSSVSLLTQGDGQNASNATVLPSAYYITTAADGTFTLTGNYSCTSGQQVYLYAVGGYSDGNSSDVNSGIGLMAVLGNCPAGGASGLATNVPFVDMNEVTTVAAGYAMAGFAYDATHVSSPSTTLALQGIRNAFANAADLAAISNGTSSAVNPNIANIEVPYTQVYTEANILASCINEAPSDLSNCTTLFSNSLQGGSTGAQPTDTATAIINITHHPYVNATVQSALWGLGGNTGAPFVGLTTQPKDWTMPIVIVGNGLTSNSPQELAIDASGNAWVADYGSGGTGTEISIFAPNGAAATTTNTSLGTNSPLSGNGLAGPNDIAFDASGNAWVTNYGAAAGTTVSVFTATGAAATTPASPLSGNGLDGPNEVAIDASGNAWVGNYPTNTISIFTSTGAAATTTNSVLSTNSPLSGNGLAGPNDIAFDISGNAWVTGYSGDNISVFTSAGAVATTTNSVLSTNSPLSGNGLTYPSVIAFDASGNAWTANTGSTTGVSEFTSTGAAVGSFGGNSGTTNGGVHKTNNVAIDSAGNVWCADQSSANLGELNSSGVALSPSGSSTAAGYQDSNYLGTLQTVPYSVAVDGSGSVWMVNNGAQSITLYIGLASPVVTPIVANLLPPYAVNNKAVNLP